MATTDLLGFVIGNFLFAGMLVMPVVVVAVARRSGPSRGFALATALGLVASALVAFVPESTWADVLSTALAVGVGIAGAGMVLWHFGSKSMDLGRLFAALVAFVFLGTVGQYLVLQWAAGTSLVEIGYSWLAQIRLSFDQYIQMLSAQISSDQLGELNALKAQKQMLVWVVFRLLPSMLLFGVAGLVLINLLLARRLLPALRHFEFNRWRVPDVVIWAVLLPALGLLPYLILPMLGKQQTSVTPLFFVSLNVVLIALVPYIMQGFGVMSFFMRRWRFPRLLRGLTYFMVLTQGLIAVVPALGLVEFWTDWRGRTIARDIEQARRDKDKKEET